MGAFSTVSPAGRAGPSARPGRTARIIRASSLPDPFGTQPAGTDPKQGSNPPETPKPEQTGRDSASRHAGGWTRQHELRARPANIENLCAKRRFLAAQKLIADSISDGSITLTHYHKYFLGCERAAKSYSELSARNDETKAPRTTHNEIMSCFGSLIAQIQHVQDPNSPIVMPSVETYLYLLDTLKEQVSVHQIEHILFHYLTTRESVFKRIHMLTEEAGIDSLRSLLRHHQLEHPLLVPGSQVRDTLRKRRSDSERDEGEDGDIAMTEQYDDAEPTSIEVPLQDEHPIPEYLRKASNESLFAKPYSSCNDEAPSEDTSSSEKYYYSTRQFMYPYAASRSEKYLRSPCFPFPLLLVDSIPSTKNASPTSTASLTRMTLAARRRRYERMLGHILDSYLIPADLSPLNQSVLGFVLPRGLRSKFGHIHFDLEAAITPVFPNDVSYLPSDFYGFDPQLRAKLLAYAFPHTLHGLQRVNEMPSLDEHALSNLTTAIDVDGLRAALLDCRMARIKLKLTQLAGMMSMVSNSTDHVSQDVRESIRTKWNEARNAFSAALSHFSATYQMAKAKLMASTGLVADQLDALIGLDSKLDTEPFDPKNYKAGLSSTEQLHSEVKELTAQLDQMDALARSIRDRMNRATLLKRQAELLQTGASKGQSSVTHPLILAYISLLASLGSSRSVEAWLLASAPKRTSGPPIPIEAMCTWLAAVAAESKSLLPISFSLLSDSTLTSTNSGDSELVSDANDRREHDSDGGMRSTGRTNQSASDGLHNFVRPSSLIQTPTPAPGLLDPVARVPARQLRERLWENASHAMTLVTALLSQSVARDVQLVALTNAASIIASCIVPPSTWLTSLGLRDDDFESEAAAKEIPIVRRIELENEVLLSSLLHIVSQASEVVHTTASVKQAMCTRLINTLIEGLLRCGRMDDAETVFTLLAKRDEVNATLDSTILGISPLSNESEQLFVASRQQQIGHLPGSRVDSIGVDTIQVIAKKALGASFRTYEIMLGHAIQTQHVQHLCRLLESLLENNGATLARCIANELPEPGTDIHSHRNRVNVSAIDLLSNAALSLLRPYIKVTLDLFSNYTNLALNDYPNLSVWEFMSPTSFSGPALRHYSDSPESVVPIHNCPSYALHLLSATAAFFGSSFAVTPAYATALLMSVAVVGDIPSLSQIIRYSASQGWAPSLATWFASSTSLAYFYAITQIKVANRLDYFESLSHDSIVQASPSDVSSRTRPRLYRAPPLIPVPTSVIDKPDASGSNLLGNSSPALLLGSLSRLRPQMRSLLDQLQPVFASATSVTSLYTWIVPGDGSLLNPFLQALSATATNQTGTEIMDTLAPNRVPVEGLGLPPDVTPRLFRFKKVVPPRQRRIEAIQQNNPHSQDEITDLAQDSDNVNRSSLSDLIDETSSLFTINEPEQQKLSQVNVIAPDYNSSAVSQSPTSVVNLANFSSAFEALVADSARKGVLPTGAQLIIALRKDMKKLAYACPATMLQVPFMGQVSAPSSLTANNKFLSESATTIAFRAMALCERLGWMHEIADFITAIQGDVRSVHAIQVAAGAEDLDTSQEASPFMKLIAEANAIAEDRLEKDALDTLTFERIQAKWAVRRDHAIPEQSLRVLIELLGASEWYADACAVYVFIVESERLTFSRTVTLKTLLTLLRALAAMNGSILERVEIHRSKSIATDEIPALEPISTKQALQDLWIDVHKILDSIDPTVRSEQIESMRLPPTVSNAAARVALSIRKALVASISETRQ